MCVWPVFIKNVNKFFREYAFLSIFFIHTFLSSRFYEYIIAGNESIWINVAEEGGFISSYLLILVFKCLKLNSFFQRLRENR